LTAQLVIPFSLDYSKVTGRRIVRGFLGQKLEIKKIIVGHDYTFGNDKKATAII